MIIPMIEAMVWSFGTAFANTPVSRRRQPNRRIRVVSGGIADRLASALRMSRHETATLRAENLRLHTEVARQHAQLVAATKIVEGYRRG